MGNKRSFMKHIESLYWKNSPDKEWEEKALKSYNNISRGKYAKRSSVKVQ